MTDKQLSDSLTEALNALSRAKSKQTSNAFAAVLLHAASVMAQQTWIDTWNHIGSAVDGIDDEAIHKELAASLIALNEMVDRTKALTEGDK